MPQLVKCPHCQKQLNVPDNLLGKNVKCPACQQAFVATAESVAEAPSASARRPPASEEPASAPPPGDSAGQRPHRGILVLILGIASIIVNCCGVTFFLGWILGGLAFYFGRADLKAMDSDEMDPAGRTMTKVGWICGIVGFVLATVGCCGGVIYGILGFVGGR